MLTSKNGNDEANAGNNHAVAFWLQVAVFSQFTGNETNLAECRRRFKEVFVQKQMAEDGSFPRELARTKPYGYSIFQLDNMVTLCQVLSTRENDLWHFALPDGRNIHKAVEFMFPYLADKSAWPRKPDVMAWDGWPARQPGLLFAGIALALASLGIYGVVSYSVEQRRGEMGIRLALGATGAGLRRLVLRQGLAPVIAGLAAGVAGAIAIGQVLQGLLFGVRVADPVTLAAVSVVLLAVASAACYVPALRVTRADPLSSLRYE